MEPVNFLIIGLGILFFSLISKWVEKSLLTLPIAFTVLGWVSGDGGLGLIDVHIGNEAIHILAEITLILVLFTDASRINLKVLRLDHHLPTRMLLVGMPLTILLGAGLTHWVSPDVPWVVAFLVAAILTPTDAALGQSVVSSPVVPVRIRQAINVESGLNDGIALPIVMVCAVLSSAALGVEVEDVPGNFLTFTIMQVTLGPLAGAVAGYAGAKLLEVAIRHDSISIAFQGIAFLSISILAYFFAEEIGGNGFIAAFIAGLAFGATLKNESEFLFEFMDSEGQLLTLTTFLIFGLVMLPLGLEHANWKTVVLAIMYLTVIRMLPIALSLYGLGLTWPTKLFLGWFGPRGLASILFVLLILERFPIPGSDEILSCVVLTVVLSIFVHGISSAPLANWYGAYTRQRQNHAEMAEIPVELILRTQKSAAGDR